MLPTMNSIKLQVVVLLIMGVIFMSDSVQAGNVIPKPKFVFHKGVGITIDKDWGDFWRYEQRKIPFFSYLVKGGTA